MKIKAHFAAALAASALLMSTPAMAQDLDAEIAEIEAVCATSAADCAAAIQAFNLRASAAPAPVLTVAQLGRIQEAVRVASVNAPAAQRQTIRRQLAQALNSAAQRTTSPPPAVVAAVNASVQNLSFGRAAEQGAGDPEPASPT